MSRSLMLFAIASLTLAADDAIEKNKQIRIEHVARPMEGWTVQVDTRIARAAAGTPEANALRLLENKLHGIALLVGPEVLAKLRNVVIVLDLDHPLKNMQYHPSAQWLKEHGHDVALARAVHIPNARYFLDEVGQNRQPEAILHELAHAYHDQVLGFEHPRIREAYDAVVKSKRFESVLHRSGRKQKHYALVNPKEFFAEMTECYFGTNDFYPFVRAELAASEPAVFELMKEVWGKTGP